MKTVIAISGPPNTGKSVTLKKVYELLKAKFPKAAISHEIVNHDVRAVFDINGFRIGLESQGDPSSRIFTSISMFAREEECNLIICATRTRGATVELIEKLKPEYHVNWLQKLREADGAKHEQINNAMAKDIVTQAEKLIHGKS